MADRVRLLALQKLESMKFEVAPESIIAKVLIRGSEDWRSVMGITRGLLEEAEMEQSVAERESEGSCLVALAPAGGHEALVGPLSFPILRGPKVRSRSREGD